MGRDIGKLDYRLPQFEGIGAMVSEFDFIIVVGGSAGAASNSELTTFIGAMIAADHGVKLSALAKVGENA